MATVVIDSPPTPHTDTPPDRVAGALAAAIRHLEHIAQTTELDPALAEMIRRRLHALLHRHQTGDPTAATEAAVLWVPRQYWDPAHAAWLRDQGIEGARCWADRPLNPGSPPGMAVRHHPQIGRTVQDTRPL